LSAFDCTKNIHAHLQPLVLCYLLPKNVDIDATQFTTAIDRSTSTVSIKLASKKQLEKFPKLVCYIVDLHEKGKIKMIRWKLVPTKEKNQWKGSFNHITLENRKQAQILEEALNKDKDWKTLKAKIAPRDNVELTLSNTHLENTYRPDPVDLYNKPEAPKLEDPNHKASKREHPNHMCVRLSREAVLNSLKIDSMFYGYSANDTGPLDEMKKARAYTMVLNDNRKITDLQEDIIKALIDQKLSAPTPEQLEFRCDEIVQQLYPNGQRIKSLCLEVKRECMTANSESKWVSIQFFTVCPQNYEFITFLKVADDIMLGSPDELHMAVKCINNALIKMYSDLNKDHIKFSTLMEFILVDIFVCGLYDTMKKRNKALEARNIVQCFLYYFNRFVEVDENGLVSKIAYLDFLDVEVIQKVYNLSKKYEYCALDENDLKAKIKIFAPTECDKIFKKLRCDCDKTELWKFMNDDAALQDAISARTSDESTMYSQFGSNQQESASIFPNEAETPGVVEDMKEYIRSKFGSHSEQQPIPNTQYCSQPPNQVSLPQNGNLMFAGTTHPIQNPNPSPPMNIVNGNPDTMTFVAMPNASLSPSFVAGNPSAIPVGGVWGMAGNIGVTGNLMNSMTNFPSATAQPQMYSPMTTVGGGLNPFMYDAGQPTTMVPQQMYSAPMPMMPPQYVPDQPTMTPQYVPDQTTMQPQYVPDQPTMQPQYVPDQPTMTPQYDLDQPTMMQSPYFYMNLGVNPNLVFDGLNPFRDE